MAYAGRRAFVYLRPTTRIVKLSGNDVARGCGFWAVASGTGPYCADAK